MNLKTGLRALRDSRLIAATGLIAMLAGFATSPEDPFAAWNQCPRSAEELLVLWANFDEAGDAYYNRAEEEYLHWMDGEDAESLFVQHIVTPALPDSMLKSVLLNCWVFYEGARRAAIDGEWAETGHQIEVWEACVASDSYRRGKLPAELRKMGRCIQRVAAANTNEPG